MKTETQLVDYKEPLKHVLCAALVYIQSLSQEMKKLNLKEKQEDNEVEKLRVATILHNMMVTINDIIHPAHEFLYEIFPGDEKLYDEMVKYFNQNQESGVGIKGCMCKYCANRPKKDEPAASESADSGVADKSTQTDSVLPSA